MKSVLIFVLVVLTFSLWAEDKTWQTKMNELSSAMSDAIPFLYPDPGKDPKGLGEKIKNIYEISKTLDVGFDHAQKVKDMDPALPYLAAMLKGDIERAYTSFQEGHVDYAKQVIRSTTSYCIACHTRTKSGAEFPLLAAYAKPLQSASWITRIEFMAASRQFDSVLSEVIGKLQATGTPGVSALDLERGAKIALSVAVRVKKDPDKAIFLARAMDKSASASFSMKEGAKVWEADIRTWQKDKAKKYVTDQEMLTAARQLIDKAQNPGPGVGFHDEVKYLRATVLMHDLMKQFPQSPSLAEALYRIGQSYSALQDLGVWSLHDMYFQACIDKSPNTEISEKCFKEYERSMVLGYSGSSGTHIPTTVKRHLEQLKKKATWVK